jgi:glutamyl-tRNA synthetase
MGDFVVRKKDGLPAYQLCSLSDDLAMKIDLIVRGEDLLESSAAQLYLAKILGEEEWLSNVTLIHHPLLLDDEGNKLSKSAGATAIAADSGSGLEREVSYIKDRIDQWMRQVNLKLI